MSAKKAAHPKPKPASTQAPAGGLLGVLQRHEWIAPVIVSMLVATVAFGWMGSLYGRPPLLHDSLGYTRTALRLLDSHVFAYGGELGDPTVGPNAAITPGYALFLAGIYAVSPRSADPTATILAVQPSVVGLQFLIGLVLVGLVAGCGYTLGGKWLAYLAGFLAALYPPFAWSTTVALSECLGAALVAAQLLLALLLTRRDAPHRIGLAVGLGVVSAVLALVRPVTAPWIVFPLLYLLVRRFLSWRDLGRVAAVALIAFVAVMSPWWLRNAVTLHQFIPLSTGAGDPAFVSTGGYPLTADEQAVFNATDAKGQDAEGAVAYYRMANQLKSDPLGFVRGRALTAFGAVFQIWSVPRDALFEQAYEPDIERVGDNPFPGRIVSDTLVLVSEYALWFQLVSVVVALLGVFFVRRSPRIAVVLSVPIYFVIAHSTTYFIPRYFLPAMPAVIVAAAATIYFVARLLVKLAKRLMPANA